MRLERSATRMAAPSHIPTPRLPPCAPMEKHMSSSPTLLAASCTAQHTARHLLRALQVMSSTNANCAIYDRTCEKEAHDRVTISECGFHSTQLLPHTSSERFSTHTAPNGGCPLHNTLGTEVLAARDRGMCY